MKKLVFFIILTMAIPMTISATGYFPGEKEQLSIYPNPADHYLQISFSSDEKPLPEITIIDLTGKTVKKITDRPIFENDVYKVTVDIDDLKSGIYFVKVVQEEKSYTKKLLVK